MSLPSISIVTPTYNQGQYIEETIQSILDQKYPKLEYIIVDGGSTDDTVDIIKKYKKHLKYWVSEKDKGQANAINKGFRHCNGEIFNWINSDDFLEKESLFKIADAFQNKAVDLVAGKVNNFSSTESEVVQNANLSATALMRWEPRVNFVQPGVWLRKKNILSCGGIDESFHYAFDWDLLIRYLYFSPKVEYLDDVLVHFRLHDKSKTVSSIGKFMNEERMIIERIFLDPRFKNIHWACKWKISRSHWTELLHNTANANNKTKLWKLSNILQNFRKQPIDIKVLRMTLGTMRHILLNNRLNF